jgi:hypothetical protein
MVIDDWSMEGRRAVECKYAVLIRIIGGNLQQSPEYTSRQAREYMLPNIMQFIALTIAIFAAVALATPAV